MYSDLNTIALIGAPNAGKTTLYNWITGSKHRTMNYPGSTIDYSVGKSLEQYGDQVEVIDTPGTYSLFPKTPDEEITNNVIFHKDKCQPKLYVVVVDGTQFTRQMVLVEQIAETGVPVIVAVTMTDILKKNEVKICFEKLNKNTHYPLVGIDGRLGGGVEELIQKVHEFISNEPTTPKAVHHWSHTQFQNTHKLLENLYNNSLDQSSSQSSILAERTRSLDKIFLHPLLGPLIFILVMGLIFTSVFWLATPFVDFIDEQINALADGFFQIAPESLWADFIGNGVIAGFGAFLVFTPQIFILFIGLNLIEDSGYMARASALIDKPLSKLGLNGRSFAPILSGFACAVPAMMAARTIPNKRERWLTLFILPLMTCSARLPVYAILLTFLFPNSALYAGMGLLILYIASLVLGGISSLVAQKFIPQDKSSFFILELPHYKRPQIKNTIKYAVDKTAAFISRAGPIIFVLAVLLWGLSTFPNYDEPDDFKKVSTSYAAQMGQFIEPVMEPMGLDWRAGFGIISSIAAREVFISTLAIIFNVGDEDDESTLSKNLLSKMKTAKNSKGEIIFSTSTVVGLLIFYIIALQCIATLGVAKQETGSWNFAFFQFLIFNLAAYLLAVASVWGLRTLGFS